MLFFWSYIYAFYVLLICPSLCAQCAFRCVISAAPVNITYDDRGREETVSDGVTCARYEYDSGIFHAPTTTTVYSGGTCAGAPLNRYYYSYDPEYANIKTVTDAIRGVTVAAYQYYGAGAAAPARGLVSAVTDADGKTVSYEYYADTGWLAGVKNPAGTHTCYAYYPDGPRRSYILLRRCGFFSLFHPHHSASGRVF